MMVHASYFIQTALIAVELAETPQETRSSITQIPGGSNVELHSQTTSGDGMVEVAWQGRKYAVFLEDLNDRGELTED